MNWRALDKKLEALERRQRQQQRSTTDTRVLQATRDPYTWVTEHTETFNDHWVEEGLPSHHQPFPKLPYIADIFEFIEAERIVWFEKSRDMMLSWCCVAYLTFNVMKVARRSALFQTQTEKKAIQLVEYAKCLYRRQSAELQAAFPLRKSIGEQPALELHFANGSSRRSPGWR